MREKGTKLLLFSFFLASLLGMICPFPFDSLLNGMEALGNWWLDGMGPKTPPSPPLELESLGPGLEENENI